MSYAKYRNLTDDELIALIREQQYGTNHGDKRHVIDKGTVEVTRSQQTNTRGAKVTAVCGQPLAYVHGVTTDWSGSATNLEGNKTCARCAKKAGIILPPKPTTCPTCQGAGKVAPSEGDQSLR